MTEPTEPKKVRGRPFVRGDKRTFRGGRVKITKAEQRMSELARMIVTDKQVQERLLQDARRGRLHPQIMVNFIARVGGSVPKVVEVGPVGSSTAVREEAERLKLLSKRERMKLAELTRKALGRPAPRRQLPRAADDVVDAELVEAVAQAPAEVAPDRAEREGLTSSATTDPGAPVDGRADAAGDPGTPPARPSDAPRRPLLGDWTERLRPIRTTATGAPDDDCCGRGSWRDPAHRAECRAARRRWLREPE